MLKESTKYYRHHRIMMKIHITFLAWLAEFVGFFVIFVGTFVLGHENNLINFSLQTITIIVYFNLLPCVFLMNTPELKDFVSNGTFYEKLLNFFNWHYKSHSENEGNAIPALEEHDDN